MKHEHILIISDYPPLNGGGLAININELKYVLSETNNVEIITSRIKDDFTCNTECQDYIYSKNKLVLFCKLVRQIIKSKVIIINFTFSYRFLSCISLLLSKMFCKKIVFVFHTTLKHLEYNRLKDRKLLKFILLKILKTLINNGVDNVVFTKTQKEELQINGIKNLDIRPMPVIFKSEYNILDIKKDIDIIYIGEISELKGIRYLIDFLKKTKYNAVIIGNGIDYYKLKEEINHQKNIKLLKTISHDSVIEYLKRSRYIFFPCINDSWGRVVFEAMYTQTRIITISDSSGVIETLNPEQYLLVLPTFERKEIEKMLINDKTSTIKNLKYAISENIIYKEKWINGLNIYNYEHENI